MGFEDPAFVGDVPMDLVYRQRKLVRQWVKVTSGLQDLRMRVQYALYHRVPDYGTPSRRLVDWVEAQIPVRPRNFWVCEQKPVVGKRGRSWSSVRSRIGHWHRAHKETPLPNRVMKRKEKEIDSYLWKV